MGLGTQYLHRHIRHLSDSVRSQFRGPAQSFSRRIIFLGQHVRHSQTIKLASLRNGVLLHRPFKLENSLLQLSPLRGHMTAAVELSADEARRISLAAQGFPDMKKGAR